MKYLITCCALLLSVSMMAQPGIAYSTDHFPEPRGGWNEIRILKNGNTVYINGTEKTLHIRIYDKDKKLTVDKDMDYRNTVQDGMAGNEYDLEGAHEINGNMVLFISSTDGCGIGGQIRNCVKSLYRFVIDPGTAKILKADKLCEAAKVKSWGYNLSTMTINDIFIKKDPVSDMYAVLIFNGYTEDMPDRIKMMTYNGNHEVVKTVVLNAPSTQDRAVHYAGMCMYNKTVYLGTNMRNAKEKGQEVPLCISMLKDGADNFETKVLRVKPFAINSDCKLYYNPGSETVDAIMTTETSKKNNSGFFSNGAESIHYFSSGILRLDGATLDIKEAGGIDGSLADVYAKEKLGEKEGFSGIMSDYQLAADKSPVIIQEEQRSVSRSTGSGSVYSATLVSKLGITTLAPDTKAKESYAIRIREVNGNAYSRASSSYFDYKYLSTPAASYIVVNDLEENFDKPEKANPHALSTISDTHTMFFKMANGKIEKSYVWEVPERRKAAKFADIGTSTFDEATHTWATLVIDGDSKEANMAWVTLD